jgi:hypothetical protein
MMRSILHTLQGLSIGGSRIKELMLTDKYHQGEKMECKAKTYLQNSGRSTSPQSTQDCEDQESEEGDQSNEDSQRSTYDSDQDCQQHGSQDILQDEDEYDYQGHEDGSQDIPQYNEGDHDGQDIDDESDSRYYKFIKDILHEEGEDVQQDTHDEDEDDQQESDQEDHKLHSQDDTMMTTLWAPRRDQ